MTLSLMRYLNGGGSTFDQIVEKATSEENTTEDWSLILTICDRVTAETNGAKECLASLIRRLNSSIPCVVMQSLTLLDSLVKNCGKKFHLEICSREFEIELQRLISPKSHTKVAERAKLLIKKWAHDFKDDPQLNLIPALYERLRGQGVDFVSSEPVKRKISLSNLPPDAVTSNQEEEDIAKAIELSLKETGGRSSKSSNVTTTAKSTKVNGEGTSLYNNLLNEVKENTKSTLASDALNKEPLKVRALYDFEAAEDNELTFKAGEIILVTDNSDANWWKGSNHRGEGLFPANFVSTDLNAEFEPSYKVEKKVQFNEEVKVKVLENEKTEPVKIDENKIDRLLHLLHEADPQSDKCDSDELLTLEEKCVAMMPLIDQKIESIDKRHAILTGLNHQLNQALNLYHELMKECLINEQKQPLNTCPPANIPPGGYLPQMAMPVQHYPMGYLPQAPPITGSHPSLPYNTPYSYYGGQVVGGNIVTSNQCNSQPSQMIGPVPIQQNSYFASSQSGLPASNSNVVMHPPAMSTPSYVYSGSTSAIGGQYAATATVQNVMEGNNPNTHYNTMQYPTTHHMAAQVPTVNQSPSHQFNNADNSLVLPPMESQQTVASNASNLL